MRTGEHGLALLKGFEKLRLIAYKPTPWDVPTIGYGHTKFVSLGDRCTQTQADAWLAADLGEAEACVILALARPPTQNQFDACVCLCFNIGCAAFRSSSVARFFNEGEFEKAAAAFLLWN